MGEATVHDLSRNGEQVQVPTTPLLTQLPANAPDNGSSTGVAAIWKESTKIRPPPFFATMPLQIHE